MFPGTWHGSGYMVAPFTDGVAGEGGKGVHRSVLPALGVNATFELFEVADAAFVQVNCHALFGHLAFSVCCRGC